jgi:preprotein translocase subunit SecD
MARQRRSGPGARGVLLICAALLAPGPVRAGIPGGDEGPVAAFRRAIWNHRSLICGDPPAPALSVVYTVEAPPGRSRTESRDRMVEILRRRAGAWDGAGPELLLRGTDAIEVVFHGPPPQVAAQRAVLERPGVLTFHAVENDEAWEGALRPAAARWRDARDSSTLTLERTGDGEAVRADTREELAAYAATLPALPADRILGFQEEDVWDRGPARSTRWRLFLLRADAGVHGGHIASATVVTDGHDGMPRISLEFTAAGGAAFADLTEALTGRLLAIVLDGRVMSAPKVMERIAGGRAQITLGSGRPYQELFEEARGLATVLQSGGHPVALTILFENSVGSPAAAGPAGLGPFPFSAQALATLLTIFYGCF